MYATCSSFYSPFYFLANNPERFHNPLQVWATMHPAGSMSIFGFEEVLEFSQIRDKRVRLWHHQVEETVEVKRTRRFQQRMFPVTVKWLRDATHAAWTDRDVFHVQQALVWARQIGLAVLFCFNPWRQIRFLLHLFVWETDGENGWRRWPGKKKG